MNVLASRGAVWKKAVIIMAVISILLGPLCYWSLPHILRGRVDVIEKQRWPYRDELTYWICPWKRNENSAEKYCMEKLMSFPNGAIVDFNRKGTELFPMLVLQQAYGVRPDVTLVSGALPGGAMWKRSYAPK
jgi:hypothetical protein